MHRKKKKGQCAREHYSTMGHWGQPRPQALGHLPGVGDGDGAGQDISLQVGPSSDPTASPSLAQSGGLGEDQAFRWQGKAGPRAGVAWPLPPTALLKALPLARWDGHPLGCADPELTPSTRNPAQ